MGRLARPFALEIVAFAAVAAVVALLRAKGLRMGWQAFTFTVPPMLGSLPRILGAGLAIHLASAAIRAPSGDRGRAVRDYLLSFLAPASLLSWLRVCAAFMLVTFAYAWLKVCIPLVNQRLYDEALWRIERALHLGFAPNVFAVELFGGTPLLPALDLWYSFWIQTVFLAWAWAAAHPDLATRRRFMLACALLSVVGPWLYLSVPALGPCYASPEIFAEAAAQMPHSTGTQQALAANYAKIVAGRDGTLRQFNPYLGIAALPSLHVAAHWLFALWVWRFARRWFPWLALATALTFFGSLATGWHYAIDGYAGMLLAWAVFAIALRIEPPPAEVPASTAESERVRPAAQAGSSLAG